MLEASGFDFRNRHPQKLLVKLAKRYQVRRGDEVGLVAYGISLDLYRTFAPLKQTTATMAFASLELASRLIDAGLREVESGQGYATWKVARGEVMGMFHTHTDTHTLPSLHQAKPLTLQETMLDLLDLYTHHRTSTVIGTDFPLEAFLAIRIPLNREADEKHLPRFFSSSSSSKPTNGFSSSPSPSSTGGLPGSKAHKPKGPKNKDRDEAAALAQHQPSNPLTPISANGEKPALSDRGRDGTVRFMLDPTRAEAEKRTVSTYFRDEMEEIVVSE
jgi:CTD kinase subunit beta